MIPANIKGSEDVSGVLGEVYAVPDENWQVLLAQLDRLEQAWKMYLRVKIKVNIIGSVKECTTFLYMPTVGSENVIKGGVWGVPVV